MYKWYLKIPNLFKPSTVKLQTWLNQTKKTNLKLRYNSIWMFEVF